jgi:hypothetical protein
MLQYWSAMLVLGACVAGATASRSEARIQIAAPDRKFENDGEIEFL